MPYLRALYRAEKKGLLILLSRTQGEPSRSVQQKQEQIFPKHVKNIIRFPVHRRIICKGNPNICRSKDFTFW